MESSAPALIYRDSDLIKRAIRDLYHRDISEVIVEGEDGYKAARGFMKLLMPSHVRRVQLHSEATPLFQRHGVEDQLSAMYQPVVQLKSGGYLVINPTEALVSIDINSGRSTREHNIEQTAFATNLEAANEIARQLRLRDMAGLIVIDFIDMEQNSHVRKVEKAMKEALKNDRARIQVGRISSFGLMEMSRQRLRTGVLEASTKPCPHCEGTGLMRTASSAGLSALRMIEDEAARGRGDKILLRAGREAAIYLLNKKRAELAEIEQPLRRFDRSRDRRELRRRADERRKLRPAADRPAPRPSRTPIEEDLEEVEALLGEEAEEDEEDEEERRARASVRSRTSVRAAVVAAAAGADADAAAARAARLQRRRPKPRPNPARSRGGRRRSDCRAAGRRRSGSDWRSQAPAPPAASAPTLPLKSRAPKQLSNRTARPWSSARSRKSRRSPKSKLRRSRSRSARRTRAKKADKAAEVVAAPEPAPAEAPPGRDRRRRQAGKAGPEVPSQEGEGRAGSRSCAGCRDARADRGQ